jgi:hypothetical protein
VLFSPGVPSPITETQIGVQIETVSEPSGQYMVPFLLPGDYAATTIW